jgi:hypothetical protein
LGPALKGHGFSHATNAGQKNCGRYGCGKTLTWRCFVKGHDFSRAANATNGGSGFTGCGKTQLLDGDHGNLS